jgi:SMI1-KNR4 cell-wall
MKYTIQALPPPTTVRRERIEAGLRVKLPLDFLNFLKTDNGGVPLKRAFPTQYNEKVIDRFLPLMVDPNSEPVHGQYDIAVVWSQINNRLGEDPDEIGSQLIPIVALEFGDMVCLDFRKNPEAPVVVVWDHEQSEEFKPVTEKVADSFTEFLSKLRPLDPYKSAIPE